MQPFIKEKNNQDKLMGMDELILYRNSTGSPVFTDTGVIPAVKSTEFLMEY